MTLNPESALLDHLPKEEIIACYQAARGKEVQSGKFNSPESSSALVANAFGIFLRKPELLTLGKDLQLGEIKDVKLERELRFPWRGGLHPWLDVVIETSTHMIGIESKRFEPFRDRKNLFSEAFKRDVWGGGMEAFEALRDELNRGYLHVDPVQLTKHAFALKTHADKRGLAPMLVYLFAEPKRFANGKEVLASYKEKHRAEIRRFWLSTQGAAVQFASVNYSDLLALWAAGGSGTALAEHAALLQQRFDLLGSYEAHALHEIYRRPRQRHRSGRPDAGAQ